MAENLDPSLTDADLAAALVRNAGLLALAMRSRGLDALRGTAIEKTGVADVVTAADTAAEGYVVEQLLRCRPQDSILGEEGAAHAGTSGRTWVIDPVDGTWNFFSGSTYWCSALALADGAHDAGTSPGTQAPLGAGEPPRHALADAEVLLGAVFQPQEDKLWLGGALQPATLNGRAVAVDARQDVSMLGGVTYIHPGWLAEARAAGPWQEAAQLPATLRMLGSGSCDLGRVAQAELGVWFQHSCPAWDWLPGKGIVRAAGGQTGVVRVNGLDWFVAGPAGAVAAISAALADGALPD
ncbi:inositol monophosphatase family protein [Arthrobacter sp. SDTb3-6]|uniref:inositol monophosphatase family protein n=1 Tax=Arthrobacter sp. SDTb3-6 TaxID=2713571 RepID=UPI00159D78ED|nr:inositol monophosphatase family protein [Arthrobacter sp. SDTb3-6]NVM99112.1 inositol monophosphatase family protein [Arthrobacter sp. SDTb3-6]